MPPSSNRREVKSELPESESESESEAQTESHTESEQPEEEHWGAAFPSKGDAGPGPEQEWTQPHNPGHSPAPPSLVHIEILSLTPTDKARHRAVSALPTMQAVDPYEG